MVVKRVSVPSVTSSSLSTNDTALLKYICCESACPGAPSNVPSGYGFQQLLYDVDTGKDWAEMHPLPLTPDSPWLQVASEMRESLPPAFANGCRNITPEPEGRFTIERSGRCVSVRQPSLHAPVEFMSANDSACHQWRQTETEGMVVFPTRTASYIMMQRHAGVIDACSPNSTAGIVRLGPFVNKSMSRDLKNSFGFELTARGELRSVGCEDLCVGSLKGELVTMSCDDDGALGFQAVKRSEGWTVLFE